MKHCVNPAHLYVGTDKDNAATGMHATEWRQNRTRGSATSQTLTEDQVVAVRERYAQGGVTYVQVAAEFGTTRVVIGKVVRGDTWAHAGGATFSHRPVGRQAQIDHDAIRAEYASGRVTQYALADDSACRKR